MQIQKQIITKKIIWELYAIKQAKKDKIKTQKQRFESKLEKIREKL